MSGFESSRYTYGGGAGRYVLCKVVNREDPEQAGRCQVRVIGYQDDKAMIPDQQLPWARSMFPTTNPMNGGVGGPVTGLMKDSVCFAMFTDADQQNIMMTGTIGKSGKDNGKGKLDTSGRNHDTNPHTRDDATGGGDKRWKTTDPNHEQGEWEKPVTEYAVSEAKDPYGGTTSKEGNKAGWSLGNHKYG